MHKMTSKRLSEAEKARRASLRKAQKGVKTREYSENISKKKFIIRKTHFMNKGVSQTRNRDTKTGRFTVKPKINNKEYWEFVKEVKTHQPSSKSSSQKQKYARNYIKWYVKQENVKRRKLGRKTITWRDLSKKVAYNKKRGIDKLPEVES